MTTRNNDVLSELRAALDVTPPQGLESRVMSRVREAAERPQHAWMITALGAALTLTMTILRLPAPTVPVTTQPMAVNPGRTNSARALTRTDPPPQRVRHTRQARQVPPAQDVVLAANDQARRFQAFVEAVAAGQVVMAAPRPVLDPEIPSLPLPPTSPVVIDAMTTEPLSSQLSDMESE
jgi:hypothetical protein